MNWQILIVIVIIALALLFVGRNFWRKTKSFSPKGNCGNDCGCGEKTKSI
ncbi:MAG TPA: FeoB-associated Cys-rich membrane protein [Pyrinomonadaceae bacterium]